MQRARGERAFAGIMFRFNVIIPHGCAAIMSAVHTFTYDIIKVLTDRTHYSDLK